MTKKKSRHFSIYLLKNGYNSTNALDNETKPTLRKTKAEHLPATAVAYILDTPRTQTWWCLRYGIEEEPLQIAKRSGLLFIPVKDRWFILSFGHAYHKIKDDSYETDFSMHVTLNAIDPKKLKGIDITKLGFAIQQRTQTPKDADLTYLDFNHDNSILRRIAGKVKDKYKDIFSNATGSKSSLRISSRLMGSNDIVATCEKLLELYKSEDYKTSFPNLEKFSEIKDSTTKAKLDEKMVEELKNVPKYV